jgi:hypothetical protein
MKPGNPSFFNSIKKSLLHITDPVNAIFIQLLDRLRQARFAVTNGPTPLVTSNVSNTEHINLPHSPHTRLQKQRRSGERSSQVAYEP